MLNNFLNKFNNSVSKDNSLQERIDDYNKKVIEENKKNEVNTSFPSKDVVISERYVDNRFNNFGNIANPMSKNFNKMGQNSTKGLQRPNTYQTPKYSNNQPQREYKPQYQAREYIDDGSYFCSYAIGGNTLVCYKNKEKVEFLLEGISHPDKNNYLAKRANYFLNDLVKKQKVYIEPTENGKYNIFLDSQKEHCINTMLINEGYHNSEPYNPENKDKKTSFSRYKPSEPKNEESENNKADNAEDKTEVKEKKNYAYGLFATEHNTFEALFNKEKITLKIANLENISKEHKKICKSMIYDFISKKSIVLKFLHEENNIRYVEVFNKEGECLNQLIANKKFPNVEHTQEEKTVENNIPTESSDVVSSEDSEQCSENDWDWVDSDNNNEEKYVPEVTQLPAMFKNPVASKENSPFKKKVASLIQDTTETQFVATEDSKIEDEKNIPDINDLPAMFKNPVASKENSPFKKKVVSPIQDTTETQIVATEDSKIEDEKNIPDINDLPAMFKTPVASKENSPFKKKISQENLETVQSHSTNIDKTQEENKFIPKKKLVFGKK